MTEPSLNKIRETRMTISKSKKLWVCVTCGRFARAKHQLDTGCFERAVHISEELCVMDDKQRITRFLGHLEDKL